MSSIAKEVLLQQAGEVVVSDDSEDEEFKPERMLQGYVSSEAAVDTQQGHTSVQADGDTQQVHTSSQADGNTQQQVHTSSQADGNTQRGHVSFWADGDTQQGHVSFGAVGDSQQGHVSSGAQGDTQQGHVSSGADGDTQQGHVSSGADGDTQQGKQRTQYSRTQAIREFFKAHENIGAENATSISGFDKLDHTKIFPPPGLPAPEDVIVDHMHQLSMEVDRETPAQAPAGQKRLPAVAPHASVAKKARYVEVPFLPQPGDFMVCQGQTVQVAASGSKYVLEACEAGGFKLLQTWPVVHA